MKLPATIPKNTEILVHSTNKTRRIRAKFMGFKGSLILVSKHNGHDGWSSPQYIHESEVICLKEK
jgi:hypothetical protein